VFAQVCTEMHRRWKRNKGKWEEYSADRLSREASKTCQHNQKRAQEPQGSCALNFLPEFYGRHAD
jgi:hypothetical protein